MLEAFNATGGQMVEMPGQEIGQQEHHAELVEAGNGTH